MLILDTLSQHNEQDKALYRRLMPMSYRQISPNPRLWVGLSTNRQISSSEEPRPHASDGSSPALSRIPREGLQEPPPPPQRCDVRRRGAALPSSQGLAAPSPSFDLYRSRTRRATQRHWPPLPWAGLHCAGPPSSVDRASSRCSIRAPWLLGRVSISTAAHRLGVARGADPCSSLLQGAMKQLEQ